MKQVLKVKKLQNDAQLPLYNKENDSGADLFAIEDTKWTPIMGVLNVPRIMIDEGIVQRQPEVVVGYRAIVKTGIAVELPHGHELQIRSRSGLAAKHNIQVKNSPGTVDEGYRNELMVILECLGKLPDEPTLNPVIQKGAKIAQAVLASVVQAEFEIVEALSESDRGMNGIGSSGVK